MPFVSEVVNAPVFDARRERIGKITDVLVQPTIPYPTVSAVEVTAGRNVLLVPWSLISQFNAEAVTISVARGEVPTHGVPSGNGQVRLVRDVLDKQILDAEGSRLIRANDLQLAQSNGSVHLVGIDISGKALIRRLGLGPLARKVAQRMPDTVISWDDVDRFGGSGAPVRLKVSGRSLATTHPADLAALVDQLSVAEGRALVQALDDETAADTLEEVTPERQVSLLQDMESGRAADILEAMGPDDAADVLGDMADAKARELLGLMEDAEAREVRELLGYPEDSAGGIMTTDYLAVPQRMTAQQTIDELRANRAPAEMAYYVYVLEDRESERLTGVVSLRELILADPSKPLTEVMTHNPITVNVNDHQDDVARLIAKYNLLAVPVIDDQRRLQGVVTVDDAIDILLPTAWKKRLPRVFARQPVS